MLGHCSYIPPPAEIGIVPKRVVLGGTSTPRLYPSLVAPSPVAPSPVAPSPTGLVRSGDPARLPA